MLLTTDRLSDRVISLNLSYGGTATKGRGEGKGDYYTVTQESSDTRLTIAPGEVTSDSVGLIVNPDTIAEGDETIVVTPLTSTNGLASNTPITVTIRE
jgi:hypothetical protein